MTTKLLKDLDFAAKLNSVEAVTESGKEVLKNYRSYMFSNPSTCGIVNGFVKEAQQYSYDKGMMSILDSVMSFLNEHKISWKLASACESISNNNSTYSYIAKTGVNKVEKLLEMNENEVIAYIKAGVLKDIQYIPEFRQICKEVFNSNQIYEASTVTYSVSTPISYVECDESGARYFSINGKTFKIDESHVEQVNDPTINTEKFKRINAHLSAFKQVGESISFEYRGSYANDGWKFVINEDEKLIVSHKTINETFDDAATFYEFCDGQTRFMGLSEKKNFMSVTNAIAQVFENIESICAIDCARVINATNGTVGSIVEAKDNINFTKYASYGVAEESNEFPFVIEALAEVQKTMGVDIKVVYEDRINEDVKKGDPEKYKDIKEQLEATRNAQFNIRYNKIAQLAEALKNDPAIVVLNTLTKELKMLESI